MASFKQRCRLSMHKELADKDIKYFIISGNRNTNSTSRTSLQYSYTLRWMNFHSDVFSRNLLTEYLLVQIQQ